MGILVDHNTRVMIQGITGRVGRAHAKFMLEYNTKVVAGVTPGRGGEEVFGIPVYDSVKEALAEHEIDASLLFVPAPSVKEAAFEAIEAGIKFMIINTDWVPIHDALEIKALAKEYGTQYLGPNSPGMVVPSEIKLGAIHSVIPGNIGVVSRSGTLLGEVTKTLTEAGIGQSAAIGVGGDPTVGLRLRDIIKLFEQDEHTKAILIIGEIGGSQEEEAAEYIEKNITKPVVAFIAGQTAPSGKKMGHAGAIIRAGRGTALSKIQALERVGVKIAEDPWEIPSMLKQIL